MCVCFPVSASKEMRLMWLGSHDHENILEFSKNIFKKESATKRCSTKQAFYSRDQNPHKIPANELIPVRRPVTSLIWPCKHFPGPLTTVTERIRCRIALAEHRLLQSTSGWSLQKKKIQIFLHFLITVSTFLVMRVQFG